MFRILILFALTTVGAAVIAANHPREQQVEKSKYLKLQINKYDEERLKAMLNELQSYEGKITEVFFDKTTGVLQVYYLSPFKMDEILRVVSIYCPDYDKIGGTEL